jgi:hypothetical protein
MAGVAGMAGMEKLGCRPYAQTGLATPCPTNAGDYTRLEQKLTHRSALLRFRARPYDMLRARRQPLVDPFRYRYTEQPQQDTRARYSAQCALVPLACVSFGNGRTSLGRCAAATILGGPRPSRAAHSEMTEIGKVS